MNKNTISMILLFITLNLNFALSIENLFLLPDTPDPEPLEEISKLLNQASIIQGSQDDPLRNCSVTAQFELRIDKQELWLLAALDVNGQKKNMGGDELYVTYHSENNKSEFPTLVALVHDLQNGSYLLRFKSTPMNPELYEQMTPDEAGFLTIHYSYTCGMSGISVPKKKKWTSGGFVNRVYRARVDHAPSLIRKFQKPQLPKGIQPFGYVLGIGDSIVRHFAGAQGGNIDAKFFRTNGSFAQHVGGPLNSLTAKSYLNKIRYGINSEEIRDILENKRPPSLLVILGSGIWDLAQDNEEIFGNPAIINTGFKDHKKGLEILLEGIKKEYSNTHNVQFAWISPIACHSHRVPNASPEALHRTKYISLARSREIYLIQKVFMKRYNIPLLDVFEASHLSADYQYDTSHFVPEYNEVSWNWFFPQSVTEETN